jgi:hypothetical protein
MKIHHGNINLSSLLLDELPEFLRDIKIHGHFNCSNNRLKSLKNCPSYISGDFYCSHNKLKDLEGCPKHIGRDFLFSGNNIKSLDYLPNCIGGDFYSLTGFNFKAEDVRAKCHVGGLVLVNLLDHRPLIVH